MMRFFPAAAVAALALGMLRPAPAQEKGEGMGEGVPGRILEKMDQVTNGYKDQEMDVKMTVYDRDGSSKSYTFNLKQKGDDKRLVRFSSGEIKGMSILTEEQNRVYCYLPGYKKVRRIAAHNMNQSFAGSDFSNADMAAVAWPRLYDASLDAEDDTHWTLRLVPKPDSTVEYARVTMKINKKTFRQEDTDYFNKSGDLVKQFRVRDQHTYKCGITQPRTIEMKDPRTGHRTELDVQEFKVDQGFKDSMFTERQLMWNR